MSGPWEDRRRQPGRRHHRYDGGTLDGKVTAQIVYGADHKPIYDPDGDYVIDFEGLFRQCVATDTNTGTDEDPKFITTYNHLTIKNDILLKDANGKVTEIQKNAGDALSFGTYRATEATNSIAGFANPGAAADPYDEDEVDQVYAKALFTSLQITFEAEHANRRFDNTMLDSGQWLARASQVNVGAAKDAVPTTEDMMVNYAFKYDGT